jgi:nicotinate-nucleotide pyrophosphorylase
MFQKIIEIALAEDCALDDVTSDLVVAKDSLVTFEINAREEIIFCGKEAISEVFATLKRTAKFKNSKLDLEIFAKDGDVLAPGKSIARGQGDAKLIFASERVLLNLIQHLSGVATLTNQFVLKLQNPKIKILDTRKTIPGLRAAQKYAVLVGGGKNHRFNLSDMVLIKDNHIAAAGGVANALHLAQESHKKIEIECDNFSQVCEVLECAKTELPDVIMLDNMNVGEIAKCAKKIRENSKKIKIEISGGVNLNNISRFAKLDVDFISIGYLTHSARAIDIGLDIVKF